MENAISINFEDSPEVAELFSGLVSGQSVMFEVQAQLRDVTAGGVVADVEGVYDVMPMDGERMGEIGDAPDEEFQGIQDAPASVIVMSGRPVDAS